MSVGKFELFLNLIFLLLKNPSETPAPTRAETREERITRKVNSCALLKRVITYSN